MTAMRPCILIPTYDNEATIEQVVDAARRHVPDVVVVDDGSGPDAGAALARVEQLERVHVIRRERNGGKGAAVKDGLRWAREHGFTHALQIDADGQHAFQDIPKLLASAQQAPNALVLARPVFDETAPKGRLIGRWISVFWVTLETLSRKIRDPLCGFRVYPVDEAIRAKARSQRMEFDPEIAVRLVWRGLEVINIPTHVRYLSPEEGGISHYRMLRDNLALGWMHTRLCVTGIFRFLFGWLRRAR